MKKSQKRVLIIYSSDGFANAIRTGKIKNFLEKRGYSVTLITTSNELGADTNKQNSGFQKLLKNAVPFLLSLSSKKYLRFIVSFFLYHYLIFKMKYKAQALYKKISKENFDVIICENTYDSYLFTKKLHGIKILDLPSPLADEIYYSNQFTHRDYKKFNMFLNSIYKKADHISFHWNLYTNYVKKNLYNKKNLFEMNWGCEPKPEEKRAEYNKDARIVFIGYLGGEWVNKQLLAKLTKLYGNIDVYGAPAPEKKYGLHYKGYAPTLDVLKNYQFGLISISKDTLRRSSFSSKHLEYLSYGLPVLTPDWRIDPLLEGVSIYFNEDNFLDVLKKYSNKQVWKKMSHKSYQKAVQWEWENVLKPLEKVITIPE